MLRVLAYLGNRKNKTDSSGLEDYPSDKGTFLMWMENQGDAWLNAEPAFRSLPGTVQGAVNGILPHSPISLYLG